MLSERLTKYGKNKKHHLLKDLKRFYENKNVRTVWHDQRLVLTGIGWFNIEIVSNGFPMTYVFFYWKSRSLSLVFKANTLDILISKLESRYPELLFINQK